MERVRFCNSGTEATMNAMRLAKAFTGRDKIMKMEGGYHGTHDAAMVSVAPQPSLDGPVSEPYSVPSTEGMFRGVLADIVVAPFNDIDSTRRLIERHGDELAAIIVEPMMGAGGGIRARDEYLKFVAEAAHQAGALLIFDEIVTFRLAYGGAQEIYGIDPDLTTLGKMIGGGFPVGAFGGRADIMSLFDPARKRLAQAGTFNGNAITMVAGIAALELLTSSEIARINGLGERLATGLVAQSRSHGVPIQVSSFGSLLQVHFSTEPIDSYRSAACGSKELSALLHIGLLNRGIFTSTRNSMSISTAMSENEVDQAVRAFADVLSRTPASAVNDLKTAIGHRAS